METNEKKINERPLLIKALLLALVVETFNMLIMPVLPLESSGTAGAPWILRLTTMEWFASHALGEAVFTVASRFGVKSGEMFFLFVGGVVFYVVIIWLLLSQVRRVTAMWKRRGIDVGK